MAVLVLLASTVHIAMPTTVVAQTNVSVAFAASTYSVDEGSVVDVEIELGTAASSSVMVGLMTTAQGGAGQDDFSLPATSVTFNTGEDSKTVTFMAEDDDVHFEAGETVKLSFAALPSGFEAGSVDETVVTLGDTNDPTTDDLDDLDVVWDSPSADSWGSMPIGNGNIGLNVWVENSGDRDLVFYLATGDAYDWMGELLKLGRIRVSMDPNPFASGATFSQRLRLRDGQIEISGSTSTVSVDLQIWVDKNNPVVHIKGTSNADVEIDVDLELWRTSERTLSGNELPIMWKNAQDSNRAFITATRYTDTVVADAGVTDKVIWYHRNNRSSYDYILEHEEIAAYTDGEDPLMNRTFGAAILGTGMTKTSDNEGLEDDDVRDIDISVYPYTAQTATVAAWRTGLQASIDAVAATPYVDRYAAHKSWWRSFWNRHWIMMSADGSDAADARMITQNYALSRFVLVAASEGEQAIHFNGLFFTVEVNKRLPHRRFVTLGAPNSRYDADYRPWGSVHWFQNIRFGYWPMLVAGDAEHMHSLFDMYIDALPLAQYRTNEYYNHNGAYFPETMTGWGSIVPRDYGTESARGENPAGWLLQPYTRYHWEGNIELALMMLYYHDITQNDDWWTNKGLPFIHEIVTFFREHYSEDGGPIRITPSQGLETLREDKEGGSIVNPTDKVAGLHFILDKLLALPEELSTEEQRTYWLGMKSQMPLIQKTVHNSKEIIASSESHSRPLVVMENVDLYSTFPFPIYGVGKPDLQLARNTFDERRSDHMGGWNQQPVHAAMVGDLTDAKNFTTRYFEEKEIRSGSISQTAFRFPVFYGPSHDYIPNVPQMGNAMIALQTMLVRYEGRRIILFPTWPDEWDVKFRVHLPYQTVLQGEFEDGEVVSMKATPSDRLEDIDYIHNGGITTTNNLRSTRLSVNEGSTAVTKFAAPDTSGRRAVNDKDTPAAMLSWSISGGDDALKFSLTRAGVLSFVAAKDFEAPDDHNGDGIYEVTVEVSDGESSDTVDLVVTLADVNEAPTADAGDDQVGVAMGTTVTLSGSASSDPDDGDTLAYGWSQTSGTTVTLSASDTETVTFTAPSGLTEADTLVFTLTVTDSQSLTDTDSVSVTVAGPDPVLAIGPRARFELVPASHNGSSDFRFRVFFSEEVELSFRDFTDGLFEVTGGSVRGAQRLVSSSNIGWEVTARPDGNDDVVLTIPGGRACSEPGAVCNSVDDPLAGTVTATVPRTEAAPAAPTARFEEVPRNHNGSGSFEFRVFFSEEVELSFLDFTDGLFEVTGGSVTSASRRTQGSNMGWDVTAVPDGDDNVYIVLVGGRACDEAGAVCNSDEDRLAATVTATVMGPQPSGGFLSATDSVTVAGPDPVLAIGPRARFELVPASHNGSSDFRFRVFFSEEVELSFLDFTDGLFEVTGGSVRGAQRLVSSSNIGWEVTARPDGNDDVVLTIPGGRACSEPGAVCNSVDDPLAGTVTATVPRTEAAPAAPTARFEEVPRNHNGSGSFEFRVFFSEEVELSFLDFTDGLFEVTGGSVTSASRRTQGSNMGWDVTAVPDGDDNVYIVLVGGRACDEAGAVCNSDEDRLAATVTATVMGPQPSGGFLSAGPLASSVAGALTVEVTDTNSGGAIATVDRAEVSVVAHPVHDRTATGQSSRSGSVADLCFVAVNTTSAGTGVGNADWIQLYGDGGSERWTRAPLPGKLS